jgi:hypothetical protein
MQSGLARKLNAVGASRLGIVEAGEITTPLATVRHACGTRIFVYAVASIAATMLANPIGQFTLRGAEGLLLDLCQSLIGRSISLNWAVVIDWDIRGMSLRLGITSNVTSASRPRWSLFDFV